MERRADCISEEATVMFMPRIKEGVELIIRTIRQDGEMADKVLKYITVPWDNPEMIDEDTIEMDFGGGRCKVHYMFGKINNHPSTEKYFKTNLRSSGLVVYENGRLIESNIFNDIWNKIHPTYNAFLGIVEIDRLMVQNPYHYLHLIDSGRWESGHRNSRML